jgi:hypothetical protein
MNNPKDIMSNEQATATPTPDFFAELFDVNYHALQPPRVIAGGKITKEQAKALGVKLEPDDCR